MQNAIIAMIKLFTHSHGTYRCTYPYVYVYRFFSKKLRSSYQMGTAVISSNETEVKILPFPHSFAASFGIHTTVLPSSDLSGQTVTHVMNTNFPLTMKLKTSPSPLSTVNCFICNRSYSFDLYRAPQQSSVWT